MNDLSIPAVLDRTGALPAMVERAAQTLASAKTAAEVLEARDMASVAYDTAKRAARLAEVRDAHDDLLSKIHRAQADALEIEAGAKRRLADEYDAAQAAKVVGQSGARTDLVSKGNEVVPPARAAGISRKEIHEARIIRDAEEADPGIVKRTINAAVDAGEEPTRAKVRRAVISTARPDSNPQPKRGKAAIAARVCNGLAALSGLPPPGEVVGYLRGTDAAVLVDEKLPDAYRWLREFTDLWSEQGDDNAEAAQ